MSNEMEEMSGIRKAALLLISLGAETSAEILRHLPDGMIQKVSYEIANIDFVNPTDRETILDEFIEMSQARQYVIDGGVDYAREVLNRALGAQRAKEVIDMLTQIQLRERPFNIARKADPMQLKNLLLNEQPQTVALILCYMQPDKAALILAQFPLELQTEIAERIGTITRTSPKVIEKIEKVIENKFSSYVEKEAETAGGMNTLFEILNSVGRGTEKNILHALDDRHPDLADEVRANLFTFEDITTLQNADVQKVLRLVDNDDLMLALKGVADEIRNYIFSNMSQRAVETMKEDMQFMGPARLSAVEEAQQKIVGVIRTLDESGEIYLRRGEQDAVIS